MSASTSSQWDMLNPEPASSWSPGGATPSASPYGDMPSQSSFSSAQTGYGPSQQPYDPYTYPGQPETNLGTTYTDSYSGQPALDPRAAGDLKEMDREETDRQVSRCPTCAGKRDKRRADAALSKTCWKGVGGSAAIGGAAGAAGGALGGPGGAALGAATGAVGGGGAAYYTLPECGPDGVKAWYQQ